MAKLIIETPESDTKDSVGGVPWAGEGTRWPLCRTCGSPMQFLAQLPLSHCGVERLVTRGQRLLLFQCQNQPGLCEEMPSRPSAFKSMMTPDRKSPWTTSTAGLWTRTPGWSAKLAAVPCGFKATRPRHVSAARRWSSWRSWSATAVAASISATQEPGTPSSVRDVAIRRSSCGSAGKRIG